MADTVRDDPFATRPEQSEADHGFVPPATIDRYRVLEPIGMGGSGVVLAAHDPDLDRAVALKIVAASDPNAQVKLLGEARAAARLAHEHVVGVYDVGVVGDRVWIAMERVDGVNLGEWLATPRPLSAILDVFAKAGRGLAAAHRAGIVHGDFKPENVLIGNDGRVRVADFGLARLGDAAEDRSAGEAPPAALSVTRSTAPAGTPEYMAPEQLSGEPVGPAADQFAFCVALYRVLAKQHPFAGDDPASWLAEMNDERVRPWPRARRAPGWLLRLVRRGLRRDPRARFASMDALLAALDRDRRRSALLSPRGRLGLAAATVAVVALVWTAGSRRGDREGGAPVAPAVPASRPAASPPPSLRENRVTANARENNVVSAAVSPDGKRIAWSDQRGKLFVRVLETGETHAVAVPPGAARLESIDWTPDGTRLVLGTSHADGVTVWSVSILDGAPSPIADGCTRAAVEKHTGRIACVSSRGRAIEILDTTGVRSRVAAVPGDLDGFAALAWSPDAERIAYVVLRVGSRERHMAIETVAPTGGSRVPVVDDVRISNALGWTGLTWLPDGRLLYTLTDLDTHVTSLWARPVSRDGESGPASLLGTFEGNPASFSVTSDGARLAYVRQDRNFDVYVAALGRSGRLDPRRFSLHDGNDYPADFARDGALLFWSDRQGRPGSLFRQRLEEDDPTALVPDMLRRAFARVTPDGKGLIWFRPLDRARGRWELVAVDEPTRFPRVVTETPQAPSERLPTVRCARVASGPCVIADDAGDSRVFVAIDPNKGRVREIARIPVYPVGNFSTWDLDAPGERIVVARNVVAAGADVSREMHLVSVTNGTLTRLPDVPGPCVPWSAVAWAPDGKWLLVTCTDENTRRCGIIRYHLDGRTEMLWESRSCTTHHPNISPDARHVAFLLHSLDTDVWMIDLAR